MLNRFATSSNLVLNKLTSMWSANDRYRNFKSATIIDGDVRVLSLSWKVGKKRYFFLVFLSFFNSRETCRNTAERPAETGKKKVKSTYNKYDMDIC